MNKNTETTSDEKSAVPFVPTDLSSFYIVGIGASAGGLDAFRELLRNLPNDTGMAFVIIQHLSPNHESLLTEILSHDCSMPVIEVKTAMLLQPNHVFVITPNVSMKVFNRVLRIEDRDPSNHTPMSIDGFFYSLANDQKEMAIGIVLSGTGADGASGLKLIKEKGGITFAQSPESAQFESMPAAAIRIDHVDFILSPSEIASELVKLSQFPRSAVTEQDGLKAILHFVKKKLGTDFSEYKESTIRRRVSRRFFVNRISDYRVYLEFLENNPSELKILFEEILIHVTEFFREPEALATLQEKIFPILFKDQKVNSMRIWVPGCSTGEEAYSIAICLSEYLEKEGLAAKVQIFATDISDYCVEKARQGKFCESIATQVSAARLAKYFQKTELGYTINKSIRDLCIFATHDVTRSPPYSKLDLIVCRNLLIYFGQNLQAKTFETFNFSLNDGGFLLLGQSENVGLATNFFAPFDLKKKIYTKNRVVVKTLPVSWLGNQDPKKLESRVQTKDHQLSSLQVQADIDRTILARFTPPTVVINEKYEILQFRGHTEQFLAQKASHLSFNIRDLVNEEFMSQIRDVVMECAQKSSPVRSAVFSNAELGDFCIDVSPINLLGAQSFVVCFEKSDKSTFVKQAVVSSEVPFQGSAEALEQELRETRTRLNLLIEDFEKANQELQSANEEIVSANEELHSTNEELGTSKEEIQSTNEELNAVNSELQNRNHELFELNNDLLNLLNSFYLPIIIVSNDLVIRRFTPTASKVLNLKIGDVGRPISDITSSLLDIRQLAQILQEVIDTGAVQEKEIQDTLGHWHQLRVRPYKTQEQKLEGAVITVLDIDQFLKRKTQ